MFIIFIRRQLTKFNNKRTIQETLEELTSEFQKFSKLHTKLGQREKDILSANDLADDIRKMPQYYELVKDFSKHLNTLNDIVAIYKESGFPDVIKMEQGKKQLLY